MSDAIDFTTTVTAATNNNIEISDNVVELYPNVQRTFDPASAQKETDKRFWQHPARAAAVVVDRERGLVEVVPKRKRLAIVGFADSSRDAAPFDDPTWEVWALNQLYRHIPRFDRWFEIHRRDVFEADTVRDTNYVGWLQTSPVPVYTCQTYPDIPNSVRYPIERVGALMGMTEEQVARWLHSLAEFGAARGKGPYLQSAIGFMIALGIVEGFEEIGLWGIDLVVGGEYEYQKANAEFWLGYAMARGIKVTIPETSALLRQLYVYGYEVEPGFWPFRISDFRGSVADYRKQQGDKLAMVYQMDGMIAEAEALREHILTLPAEHQAALDAIGMGVKNIEGRIAAIRERRQPEYDAMRAIEGAISGAENLLEMALMVQRGVTVKTSWGSTLNAPFAAPPKASTS